jgi:hypothetical protein
VLPDPFLSQSEFGEHAVLILGLAFLLAVVAVAAFPCWNHSRRWGYAPCTTAAVALFFVALVAVGGKPAASETVSNTKMATVPAAPVHKHHYVIDSSREPIPLKRSFEPASIATAAATNAPETASQ